MSTEITENVLDTSGTHLIMVKYDVDTDTEPSWVTFLHKGYIWYLTNPKVGRVIQLPRGYRFLVTKVGTEYRERDGVQIRAVYLKEWG